MISLSTRFKELILGPTSFPTIFNGGRILVYSGTRPATADGAAVGTLLAQITRDGAPWAAGGASAGGLTFEQSGVWIGKQTGTDWKVIPSAAGTAGWFRLVGPATDAGALSFALPRVDGDIGSDMVFENTVLTVGDAFHLQQFLYTIGPTGV